MILIDMLYLDSIDMEFRIPSTDESDTACGLLRCVDPYYVRVADPHELSDWKQY